MQDAEIEDLGLSAIRFYNDHGKEWAERQLDHKPDDWTWGWRSLMARDPQVLDVGCGTGRAIRALEIMGMRRYIGIDASPTMLAIARERFPSADLRLGNALTLKESVHEPCDGFLCCAMLMQVPRNRVVQVLCSMRSVLKPEAAGYVVTPSGSERYIIAHENRPGIPEGYKLLLQQWTLDDLTQALESSGFEIIEPFDDGHMLNILVRAA